MELVNWELLRASGLRYRLFCRGGGATGPGTLRARVEDSVEQDGGDDDGADDDLLHEGRDAEQVEAVAEHAHDEGADQRPDERSRAAEQAGAADDGGGDRVQLVHDPGNRLRRVESR